MRRLALALTLLFAAPALAAAAPPAAVPLDQGWELSFDHSDWQPTTVPGVFDASTAPETFGGRVGWYRLTFRAPEAADGYSWALRFDTVRRVADVTLNGEHLGTNTEPYLPFEFDATSLRPGEDNVLEVRVDNRKDPDIPREGWWNWGGIIRPVTLIPKGSVELEDGAVMTRDIDGGRATMLFDGWVRNRSGETLSPQVAVALDGGGGGRGRATVADLAPGERRQVSFEFSVDHPRLWAPDHPELYDTRFDTTVGGVLQQRDERHTGIRTIRVVDGMLELNGHPVELRGASIHEDVKGHGPALTETDMDDIVAKLKALHANVTRSHYLLNDRLLDRFDKAGILVWSQAPVYHRDTLLETAPERQAALSTLAGTVLGARGHAAVMTHSVANELSTVPDTVPGVRTYVDAARRLDRRLDPTLPPSIDMLSYPGYPRAETYARFPLLGINSYFGWYHGKENHPVGDINGFAPYLRRMQRQYPEAAKVVTEFGAEATLDGPADRKQTYAFQSAYVQRALSDIEDAPGISGAIYWTLQEFAVKPFWDGGAELESIQTDSIHNKGLISYDGTRKPAWDVAEREFAATPLYRDAPQRPATGSDPAGWFLVVVTPLSILALLLLAGWALRDIWRFTRPPEGEVLRLPARRAA
ncbi:MAG: glycoside hydrolase family 2 protein [Solirubrobacteraceae bacterium]